MTNNSLEQNPEQSRTLSVNDDHQIHDETRPPGSEDCPKLHNGPRAISPGAETMEGENSQMQSPKPLHLRSDKDLESALAATIKSVEPSYNDNLAALTYRQQRRLTIWATCLITASVIVSIMTLTLTLYSRLT